MKRILKLFLLFVLLFQFRFADTFIPAQAAELKHVVLQLRWDNQFQFGGYYAADWQGFYRAEGLEVEIISALTPAEKILSATGEVSAGRADFGIDGADILIC